MSDMIHMLEVDVMWVKRLRVWVPSPTAYGAASAAKERMDKLIAEAEPTGCVKHAQVTRESWMVQYKRGRHARTLEDFAKEWAEKIEPYESEDCIIHNEPFRLFVP